MAAKLNGTVFKRCGCTTLVKNEDGTTVRKALGAACPKLTYKNGRYAREHGTWRIQLEVPFDDGGPREHIRATADSETAAKDLLAAVAALLRLADGSETPNMHRREIAALIKQRLASRTRLPEEDEIRKRLRLGQDLDVPLTVGQYLTDWLAGRTDLAGGTLMAYEMHIRVHLIPHLGHLRLDRLNVTHIQAMRAAIEQRNRQIEIDNQRRADCRALHAEAKVRRDKDTARIAKAKLIELGPPQRTTGPTTVKRIRATLSSALADAIPQQLITVNPAKLIRLPGSKHATNLIWTAPRVEEWRKTGVKPSRVMIWTVEQTIGFLTACRGHRYAVVYHLMAITGMRRGEAAGLHWRDVDLERGELAVTCQLAQIGWKTEITYPKTGHSLRQIALEPALVELLRGHKAAQGRRRIEVGEDWTDTGLVFTRDDGTAIHPAQLTAAFYKLVAQYELPPVRLHDLRHGTATHALTAGIDVKLVQDLLGHATSTFTRDVYTGVADQARREAAKALTDLFTPSAESEPEDHGPDAPESDGGDGPTGTRQRVR